MLVFIPDGSGILLKDATVFKKNVETVYKFRTIKLTKTISVVLNIKGYGSNLKGVIYNIKIRPKTVKVEEIPLIPVKIKIKGTKNVVYTLTVQPLSDLPLMAFK